MNDSDNKSAFRVLKVVMVSSNADQPPAKLSRQLDQFPACLSLGHKTPLMPIGPFALAAWLRAEENHLAREFASPASEFWKPFTFAAICPACETLTRA
jgi:hypothetical protein